LIRLYKHIDQSSRWATRYLETYTALSNTVTFVTVRLFPSANSYCPHFFSYCLSTYLLVPDSLATLLLFLRFFLHILFRHFFSLSSGSIHVCVVSCLLIFTILPYSILNSFFLVYVWTSKNSTLDPQFFSFMSGRPKIPPSFLDFSYYVWRVPEFQFRSSIFLLINSILWVYGLLSP